MPGLKLVFATGAPALQRLVSFDFSEPTTFERAFPRVAAGGLLWLHAHRSARNRR